MASFNYDQRGYLNGQYFNPVPCNTSSSDPSMYLQEPAVRTPLRASLGQHSERSLFVNNPIDPLYLPFDPYGPYRPGHLDYLGGSQHNQYSSSHSHSASTSSSGSDEAWSSDSYLNPSSVWTTSSGDLYSSSSSNLQRPPIPSPGPSALSPDSGFSDFHHMSASARNVYVQPDLSETRRATRVSRSGKAQDRIVMDQTSSQLNASSAAYQVDQDGRKKWSCRCGTTFTRESDRKRHVENSKRCRYSNVGSSEHQLGTDAPNPRLQYVCDRCNKSFSRYDSMTRHQSNPSACYSLLKDLDVTSRQQM